MEVLCEKLMLRLWWQPCELLLQLRRKLRRWPWRPHPWRESRRTKVTRRHTTRHPLRQSAHASWPASSCEHHSDVGR